MNAIRRLCMHQRNANAFQEAERDKALFSIAKSIVLERESRASKDFLSIGKIKAVVLEIGSSLGFAPRKPHFDSVYTNRIFVKGRTLASVRFLDGLTGGNVGSAYARG